MASATRKTVEKTITEDVIVLELTKSEADWLRDALDNEYGSGIFSGPIIRALEAPTEAPTESNDRPIQVGDKVRILKSAYDSSYNGRIGVIGEIDEEDSNATYRVQFPGGYDYEWATTVERVND